jgi:hypothetical protein
MPRTLVKAIALLGSEIGWTNVVKEASKELAPGELHSLAQFFLFVVFICPSLPSTSQRCRQIGNGSTPNMSGITGSLEPTS